MNQEFSKNKLIKMLFPNVSHLYDHIMISSLLLPNPFLIHVHYLINTLLEMFRNSRNFYVTKVT